MTPAEIRLAFDSGWTDGNPGNGRLRLDAPSPIRARHVYINACDAQQALLEDLVPTWGIGDVLVIERIGGVEPSRIVAWVIGPVRHGGNYWKIPIVVRTVAGSFAAHDDVRLTQYPNEAALAPSQPVASLAPVAPVAPQPLVRPEAADVAAAGPALTPVAPVAASLEAENAQLLALLRELTADTTPLDLVTDRK